VLTHLVDFVDESVKVEPIIVGLMVGTVYKWRGAGGGAPGKAGGMAGGSVDRGRRPSVHQCFKFCFEGAVIVIVSVLCG